MKTREVHDDVEGASSFAFDSRPVFFVRRSTVRLLGRFLAFPHALEWEAGAVGLVPWLALSASASVAAARGVLGPILAAAGAMPREREPFDERVSEKRKKRA